MITDGLQPSIILPSYSQGFARSAGESANPGLWKNLVGAWVPALGPTGGTLHDVSGNGNDGTLTNMEPGTDWVASENGWALDFDDMTTDIVETGKTFSLGDYCTWVFSYKPRAGGNNNWVMSQRESYATLDWQIYCDLNLDIKMNIGTTAISMLAVPKPRATADVWNHFAIVKRGTASITPYRNGIAHPEETMSATMPAGSDVFTVGNAKQDSSSLYSANGSIGLILLYDRPITTSEIRHLYLDPLAPFRRRVFMPFGVTATPATTTATSYFYQHLLAGTSC